MAELVVDNRTDRNVALANSVRMEAMIANPQANKVEFPQGELTLERPLPLRNNLNVEGNSRGSTLRLFSGNALPVMAFAQIGYTSIPDVQRPLREKENLFEYRYYEDYSPAPADGLGHRVRRLQVDKVGDGLNTFTTSPARILKHEPPYYYTCYQRFWEAWVCGDLKAGALSCTVLPSQAPITKGMYLWLTDGPLVNAGWGVFRKVVAVEGSTVWFDRPVPRDFGPALLADIKPLLNAGLRNLRIDPGSYIWSAQVKGTVNLTVEGVELLNGTLSLISSGNAQVFDCRGGSVELNTVTDSVFQSCRMPYLYGEEGSSDNSFYACHIGPTIRGLPQNCVTAHVGSDRWKFRNVLVEGAGQLFAGYPSSGFSLNGIGHDLDDVQDLHPWITNGQGHWNYFAGDLLRITRFTADKGVALQVLSGKGIDLQFVRGPYIGVYNSSGRASFCDPVDVVGTGWQLYAVPDRPRQAMQEAAAAVGAKELFERPKEQPPRPIFNHCQPTQPGNLPPKR